MTTGKTIALTRRSFVGKVMSLLFNMQSRLFITFLPKRKRLLISWLQSPSTVILLLLLLSRFSRVRLCATPWTAAYQASPSMGFSRQEHWSGLPFPSPIHERKSESEVAQSLKSVTVSIVSPCICHEVRGPDAINLVF